MKNVSIGLRLYLFNYSDRKLHGIFQAVSPGQMNINRYAWAACEGVESTPYPSQVMKAPIGIVKKEKERKNIINERV